MQGAVGGGEARRPRLTAEERAELLRTVRDGSDPETTGISAYTREDFARLCAERFGKTFHPSSMSRILKKLGLSRQKTRPSHPLKDPAAQAAFKKSPGDPGKYTSTH